MKADPTMPRKGGATPRNGKNLGWQNFLDQSIFKFLEIRGRVAAESPALRPHRLTARSLRQAAGSDGARSSPFTSPRSRVATAAGKRTDPRTTSPGDAIFRPLHRRS
jgi:hypothetical protein